jgi:predicted amidohydrolase
MTRIAVGQFSATQDVADNREQVARLVGDAAELDAALVVLPEYSSFTPPRFDGSIVDHAEPLDGPFATTVCDLARRHGIAVVVGMIEQLAGSSKVHNTLLMVDPDGTLSTTYRKVHLYDAHGVRESEWIVAGEPGSAATMDLDGLRIGAQTCYDLRFPEATRVLVDAGAEVVVVPAQWVPGPRKEDHWTTLLRARAIENTVYVAAAGQSAPTGSGCSMVIDPMGVVAAGLGDRVGVAAAPVDRERIEQVRSANPVLAARRLRVVPRED